MSNSEKMKRLREKLLDAGLNGTVEDARLCAEALGMMPPEDDGARNVGSNAAPPAAAVKQAKEMLAREGWVVLDHLHSADDVLRFLKRDGVRQPLPSFQETLDALKAVKPPEPAGETLHRTKREGIDLFMGQGFPRFDSALFGVIRGDEDHLVTVLKNRSGVGPLLRWMSPAEFAAANVSRAKEAKAEKEATHWFVPNAVTVAANTFAYCPEGRRVLAPGGSVFKTLYSPGMKVRTPIPLKRETDNACDFFGIATLCRRGYGEEPEAGFSQHGRIYATKMIAEAACGTTPDPIAWLVPYKVTASFNLAGKRFFLSRTGTTYEALTHAPFSARAPIPVVLCKGPLAFGHAYLKSSLIAGVSSDVDVFETREQAARSCAGLDAAPKAEPTYWLLPSRVESEVTIPAGTYVAIIGGRSFHTTEAGTAGRRSKPIPLRSNVALTSPNFRGAIARVDLIVPESNACLGGRVYTTLEEATDAIVKEGGKKPVEPVAWLVLDERGGEAMVAASGSPVWSDGGKRTFQTMTEVEFGGSTPRRPYPLTISGVDGVPAIADAGECVRLSGFSGSVTGKVYSTEALAKAALEAPAVPTHWFVPLASIYSEPGNRVTQAGSAATFYTLACTRELGRAPIPLRLDPSGSTTVPAGGHWRLYRPGVSYAGSVYSSLSEAQAALASPSNAGETTPVCWMVPARTYRPATELPVRSKVEKAGCATIYETMEAVSVGDGPLPVIPLTVRGDGLRTSLWCGDMAYVNDSASYRSTNPDAVHHGHLFTSKEAANAFAAKEAAEQTRYAAALKARTPARFATLDLNVAGQSYLTILHFDDGALTATTTRGYPPGPVMKTVLSVINTCVTLKVPAVYSSGWRHEEIARWFDVTRDYLAGKAIHNLSPADEASFLRLIEQGNLNGATIPVYKSLPDLPLS